MEAVRPVVRPLDVFYSLISGSFDESFLRSAADFAKQRGCDAKYEWSSEGSPTQSNSDRSSVRFMISFWRRTKVFFFSPYMTEI
jgi:hypothetical protein